MIWLLASALAAEPIVDDLAAIEATPGSPVWDRAVAFHLLLAYDRDGSGALDKKREVDAIPCDVFVGLDVALAERSEYPGLYATYGFPEPLVWLGTAIGFGPRVRERAEERVLSCGIVAEGPDVGPHVDPEIQDFVTGMMMGIPDAGSPIWLERARLVLLLTYDADDSGWIETVPELRSVDCRVWQALDESLLAEGDDTLVDLLGLRSGLPYGGDLLGIHAAIAPSAYDTARRCDLRNAGW